MDGALDFLLDFVGLGDVSSRLAEGLTIIGFFLVVGDLFFDLPELEGTAVFIGIIVFILGIIILSRRDKSFSIKEALLSKGPT
ncbi:MAG: hypothetical protein H8Z69_00910 [Nanohaloarchaea archaeon]|nr:hypothetical protein [Candidatus Nanohaloarchaea archaeon]